MNINKTLKKIITHKHIFTLICWIYNYFFSKLMFIRKNRCLIEITKAMIRCKKVNIHGRENTIQIGYSSRLNNCKISIIGNRNKLIIGDKCRLNNVTLWLEDNNNMIIIDDYFTMEGGSIAATEGTSIVIGKDCMFSYSIDIRSGDSHGIFSQDGHRINQAKDILIGSHIWIGAGVTILKGSQIPNGSVIGHSSLVASSLDQPNSIYTGIPARLKKSDIEWSRHRDKT